MISNIRFSLDVAGGRPRASSFHSVGLQTQAISPGAQARAPSDPNAFASALQHPSVLLAFQATQSVLALAADPSPFVSEFHRGGCAQETSGIVPFRCSDESECARRKASAPI